MKSRRMLNNMIVVLTIKKKVYTKDTYQKNNHQPHTISHNQNDHNTKAIQNNPTNPITITT